MYLSVLLQYSIEMTMCTATILATGLAHIHASLICFHYKPSLKMAFTAYPVRRLANSQSFQRHEVQSNLPEPILKLITKQPTR